ncbi:MAG: hypothetical protein JWM31_1171 [Solirubrobacterales bacterium]|nr:hypothetical protein [Solirubrobacterales bacterium]
MTAAEVGWIGAEVEAEFPGLGLVHLAASVVGRDDIREAAAAAKARLEHLEAYFSGAVVRELPARPLTGAYRVFFRQIGLDPDTQLTPIERIARERLGVGRFRSRGLLQDTLKVAALETEVPVLALRAAEVLGPLGITTSRDGERLGGVELPPSTLVIADAARPLAILFGGEDDPAPHAADHLDPELMLYAPIVPGVSPAIAGEALWLAAQMLGPLD